MAIPQGRQLFSQPFRPEVDTIVLNNALEEIYRLLSGLIDDDNVVPGGIGSGSIADGAVGDDQLSDNQPTKPSAISIVGSLDATTNIRQADVTWAQTGSVEAESWEVRWREQGETIYLYEQVGTQSLRIKNLKPAITYEIGVQTISRTGIQSGYAAADETHLTGAGDQPPEVSLEVDKLTAGTMAAEVILSGNIRTADNGARVQLDSSGWAIYDSADDVKVQADTAGVRMFGPVGSAISQFWNATGEVNGGTSLTVANPGASSVTGDIAIAFVYNVGGTNVSITPPTGFTLIRRRGSAAGFAAAAYYKVITNGAGETSPYTFTLGSAVDARVNLFEFRGVSTTDPIDTSNDNTGTSTSIGVASVTTSAVGGHVIAGLAQSSATAAIGSSDGFKTVVGSAGSATIPIVHNAAHKAMVVPEASGASNFTSSVNAEWATVTVALNALVTGTDEVIDLIAGTGSAILRGAIDNAAITAPLIQTDTSSYRVELGKLFPYSPAGYVMLHNGSAHTAYPAWMLCDLNSSGATAQSLLQISSGRQFTTTTGTISSELALNLFSDSRDGTVKRLAHIDGSVILGNLISNGTGGGVGLLGIDTTTEPTSSPANGLYLWESNNSLQGRNADGIIWAGGPIRHYTDTGSDTGVATVLPSYESLSSDCVVSFTTNAVNTAVIITGHIRFSSSAGGWFGAAATVALSTTPVGTPSICLESTGAPMTIPVNYGGLIATPGTYTFRIMVGKTVGAGTLTVAEAYIQALVIG